MERTLTISKGGRHPCWIFNNPKVFKYKRGFLAKSARTSPVTRRLPISILHCLKRPNREFSSVEYWGGASFHVWATSKGLQVWVIPVHLQLNAFLLCAHRRKQKRCRKLVTKTSGTLEDSSLFSVEDNLSFRIFLVLGIITSQLLLRLRNATACHEAEPLQATPTPQAW